MGDRNAPPAQVGDGSRPTRLGDHGHDDDTVKDEIDCILCAIDRQWLLAASLELLCGTDDVDIVRAAATYIRECALDNEWGYVADTTADYVAACAAQLAQWVTRKVGCGEGVCGLAAERLLGMLHFLLRAVERRSTVGKVHIGRFASVVGLVAWERFDVRHAALRLVECMSQHREDLTGGMEAAVFVLLQLSGALLPPGGVSSPAHERAAARLRSDHHEFVCAYYRYHPLEQALPVLVALRKRAVAASSHDAVRAAVDLACSTSHRLSSDADSVAWALEVVQHVFPAATELEAITAIHRGTRCLPRVRGARELRVLVPIVGTIFEAFEFTEEADVQKYEAGFDRVVKATASVIAAAIEGNWPVQDLASCPCFEYISTMSTVRCSHVIRFVARKAKELSRALDASDSVELLSEAVAVLHAATADVLIGSQDVEQPEAVDVWKSPCADLSTLLVHLGRVRNCAYFRSAALRASGKLAAVSTAIAGFFFKQLKWQLRHPVLGRTLVTLQGAADGIEDYFRCLLGLHGIKWRRITSSHRQGEPCALTVQFMEGPHLPRHPAVTFMKLPPSEVRARYPVIHTARWASSMLLDIATRMPSSVPMCTARTRIVDGCCAILCYVRLVRCPTPEQYTRLCAAVRSSLEQHTSDRKVTIVTGVNGIAASHEQVRNEGLSSVKAFELHVLQFMSIQLRHDQQECRYCLKALPKLRASDALAMFGNIESFVEVAGKRPLQSDVVAVTLQLCSSACRDRDVNLVPKVPGLAKKILGFALTALTSKKQHFFAARLLQVIASLPVDVGNHGSLSWQLVACAMDCVTRLRHNQLTARDGADHPGEVARAIQTVLFHVLRAAKARLKPSSGARARRRCRTVTPHRLVVPFHNFAAGFFKQIFLQRSFMQIEGGGSWPWLLDTLRLFQEKTEALCAQRNTSQPLLPSMQRTPAALTAMLLKVNEIFNGVSFYRRIAPSGVKYICDALLSIARSLAASGWRVSVVVNILLHALEGVRRPEKPRDGVSHPGLVGYPLLCREWLVSDADPSDHDYSSMLVRSFRVCLNVLYRTHTAGDPESVIRPEDASGSTTDGGHQRAPLINDESCLTGNAAALFGALCVFLLVHPRIDGGIVGNRVLRWNPYTLAARLCTKLLSVRTFAAAFEREPFLTSAFTEYFCDASEVIQHEQGLVPEAFAFVPSLVELTSATDVSVWTHDGMEAACGRQLREYVRIILCFVALVASEPAPPAAAIPLMEEHIMPTLAGFATVLARVLLPEVGGWHTVTGGADTGEEAGRDGNETPEEFMCAFGGQDGRVRRQRFLAVARDAAWLGAAGARGFSAELKEAMANLERAHGPVPGPQARRARTGR